MVFSGILFDRMPVMFTIPRKTAINMQNLVFSEIFGHPCCNSNVNSRNETYAANLIFMW